MPPELTLLQEISALNSANSYWGLIGLCPSFMGPATAPLPEGVTLLVPSQRELPEEWKIVSRTDYEQSIEESMILLMISEPISFPLSISEVQSRTRSKLLYLHVALRICGVDYQSRGVVLTGQVISGQIDMRSIEYLPDLYPYSGDVPRPYSSLALAEAWTLAERVELIMSGDRYERLKRTWSALVRAFRDDDGWEALHQFVRVLEGVSAPPETGQGSKKFAERLDHIIPGSQDRLKRLYNLRSMVEHMAEFDGLPKFWKPEDITEDEAFRRASSDINWVEIVACQVMKSVLTHRDLEKRFRNISDFRNFMTPNVCRSLWKDEINVEAVLAKWEREYDNVYKI